MTNRVTVKVVYMGLQGVSLTWSQADRFNQKVVKIPESTCWHWTGCINSRGFGLFRVNKRLITVHRLAYLITHGPIQKNRVVKAWCSNKLCVNPAHLKLEILWPQNEGNSRWKSLHV